uniref:ribosomal protein S11 n=1 Tax=Streptofilum capillatum TaxID=2058781 RepID=UPI00286C4878|nr:ribosomal protein S11 [Streptofilum capillatum]WKT08559.1 ribosomal protein S11 [Streptofilum capillatum]WKT08658.1 ribosomal protein S11 [Streptofilum sp. BC4-VF8pt]WKT08757.1 ribosomal protein S11 [Streptofilum sp. ZNP2-VF4pt]
MARQAKKINPRKSKRKIPKGIVYIQSTLNNTIVTITNPQGAVLSWYSAGACGFKGAKKGTPFAAQTAAENAIRRSMDQGMRQAEIMVSGPSSGRETALRTILNSGIRVTVIRDVTPLPHNGCRAPKRRRT